jgi:beta-glucosidase/6-phospho-beta-glucosidase/beta-galactosidase/ABC-type amino acid transport substrate-binding protein
LHLRNRGPNRFPHDFLFGVASADHQCEAYDGRDDIRDVWERVRALTVRARATEFWTRYQDDVALAARLGCRIFRISLSWARLEPSLGGWDAGVEDHYRDILRCIRSAGMKTVVTLHHNTWPVHVQAAGDGAGMLDDQFPARLAAYARRVAETLGDLVDFWITINEPNQLIYGYTKAWWMRAYPMPPGLEPLATEADQMGKVLKLIPNLFRAHTRAREAIQRVCPQARVGSNPLVLGLPRWIRSFVDLWATRISENNLMQQAKTLARAQVFAMGRVDVCIAQFTLTASRSAELLFTEPYFVAHLSVLHPASKSLPRYFEDLALRVGVTDGAATADQAASYFPNGTVTTYPDAQASVAALDRGEIDLVFDDDVALRPYGSAGYTLEQVAGPPQPFAVAMPLGSRSLLNAIDSALRRFKDRDPVTHQSPWDVAMTASFEGPHGDPPEMDNRKTVANVGTTASALPAASAITGLDGALDAIRKRGVLRVGIHPGVPGLCLQQGTEYVGLEPTMARYIVDQIFGLAEGRVEFVPLKISERVAASRSALWFLDPIRKLFSMLTTVVAANWWSLGMAGRLPSFLCPLECIGTLDFVGLDYYWGFDSVRGALHLPAAMECHYSDAPVWPSGLYNLLVAEHRQFPEKPLIVIENGCVTAADGVRRAVYLTEHIAQVQRAVQQGVPVLAYLCWSVTSNREWGLPFDNNSDFGLYHVELDRDPLLTRVPTDASQQYATIIARRSAQ